APEVALLGGSAMGGEPPEPAGSRGASAEIAGDADPVGEIIQVVEPAFRPSPCLSALEASETRLTEAKQHSSERRGVERHRTEDPPRSSFGARAGQTNAVPKLGVACGEAHIRFAFALTAREAAGEPSILSANSARRRREHHPPTGFQVTDAELGHGSILERFLEPSELAECVSRKRDDS